MENVKCEGCKYSGNCYQEECYGTIKSKCNEYEAECIIFAKIEHNSLCETETYKGGV